MTEETIVDIQKSITKVMDKVSKINADNLSYVDIKYIRENLMSALSDTDSLVDDLMAEAVKDKYGDYEEDQHDPYYADMLITDYFCVESVKKYRGHEVRVILYKSTGCRCGYVKLMRSAPDRRDIECHGGVTFNEPVKSDDARFGGEPGHWIGFDCGHICDKADVEALEKYFGAPAKETCLGAIVKEPCYTNAQGVVRTTEYVLNECYKIVDQLVDDFYNR